MAVKGKSHPSLNCQDLVALKSPNNEKSWVLMDSDPCSVIWRSKSPEDALKYDFGAQLSNYQVRVYNGKAQDFER